MKKFILDMLSSNTGVSSKRMFGGIGFICAIVFIALWGRTLIDTLLFISAALLGLETVTGVFNKTK